VWLIGKAALGAPAGAIIFSIFEQLALHPPVDDTDNLLFDAVVTVGGQ
jgi:hypothetical protein